MFDDSIEKNDRIERILQELTTEPGDAAPTPGKSDDDVDDPGPNE